MQPQYPSMHAAPSVPAAAQCALVLQPQLATRGRLMQLAPRGLVAQSVADWHPQVLLATQLTPDGFPAQSAATTQPTHAPLKHAGPPPAAAQSALVMQPHVRLGRQVPPSLWELVELRLQSVSVVHPQTPLGRQARPEL